MFGFNVNKLKPNLKMAVHRIGIVKNKKANAALAQRREVGRLLADGKEEKARIRVGTDCGCGGIIRDDFTMEGYEILELLCELLAERANLIKMEADCPYDMREAVCTLIWAASRTEIPELAEVKKQLTKKYGQDFEAAAIRNVDGCVNERVIQKLSVQPPSAFLVVNYMKEIAKEFKVDWEPDEAEVTDPLAPIPAPTGATVMSGAVSGPEFTALYAPDPPPGNTPSYLPNVPAGFPSRRSVNAYTNQPTHYYSDTRPSQSPRYSMMMLRPATQSTSAPAPYTESLPPSAAAAPAPAPSVANGGIPDFDELTARFERLRKRQDRHDQDNASFTF
ncbi:Vacuolar protein sorting-associated protein Ist1 [Phytophthora cactorum]|nr:Vacuolar protein sorting-associated protein Ist1 [Phytophthora cactorum]